MKISGCRVRDERSPCFFCFETALKKPRRFYPKHSNSYQRQAMDDIVIPLRNWGMHLY